MDKHAGTNAVPLLLSVMIQSTPFLTLFVQCMFFLTDNAMCPELVNLHPHATNH